MFLPLRCGEESTNRDGASLMQLGYGRERERESRQGAFLGQAFPSKDASKIRSSGGSSLPCEEGAGNE